MPRLRSRACRTLLPLALWALVASVADAQLLDDRTRTTPTGWWYLPNATESQINTALASQWRLVDLSVRSTSPWRFDAVAVQNSGPYNLPAAAWFYRRTAPQLRELLRNGMRLTDLEVTVVGNVPYYAGILVPNSGAHYRDWSWIPAATTAELDARLAQGWRLVSLTRYTVGNASFWAGVIHRNTGAQRRNTWWYPSLTAARLGELLGENQAQLVDLDRTPAGRWTAVMTACSPCSTSGWFYDATTPDALLERVAHQGLRLVDARMYLTASGARWAGVAVENLDPAGRRIVDVLGSGNRRRAFYLKQVGGPVRTGLRQDLVHEPLSAVKVLIHLRAFQEIATVADLRSTRVDRIAQTTNPPCWDDLGTTETLEDALTQMMWVSDNGRSKAVIDLVGRGDINAMAAGLGMANTAIVTWNCVPRPPNRWTLREAGLLYESVALGTSIPTALRGEFYRLMPGRVSDFDAPVNAIIAAERPAGMSNADLQSFQAAWAIHYKAGSWDHPGDQWFAAVRAVNVAGLLELPRCNGAQRTTRQYVFGLLVESAPAGSAYDDYHRAKAELFREPIREALATWAACAP